MLVYRVPSVLERVMGIEPTTSCLGSRHSTTELHPLNRSPEELERAPFNGHDFGVSRN